jgi:NAD-dependent DNA ligase
MQYGGGQCSLCGSEGTTKASCPLNPDAKKPNFEKHPNAAKRAQRIEKVPLFTMQQFRTHGTRLLETLNKSQIKKIIEDANSAYYNNVAFMTDDEFDVIKEYFERKYPSINLGVGAKVTHNKVTLPYFMGSMNKLKPDTGAIDRWKNIYGGPYVLSTKMDGVSGLFVMKDGKKKLYTRGDGTVGQDISHFIPHLKLPTIGNNMAIRGEFIIKKNVPLKGPARNYVSGLMNRLTFNPSDYAVVDFVAYEVIEPSMRPSEQFEYLRRNAPYVVKHKLVQSIDNSSLSDLLLDWRSNYDYEIDGIIVTSNNIYERKRGNPEHSFAFKMVLSDQIVEAKVLDVEWSASKHGLLKPRVRIEDVYIGGVRISYATGFNAKFIMDNNIGVGAVVKLIRSGDVIPHIMSVVKPAAAPIMPAGNYTWTSTGVDIMLVGMQQDETVQQKRVIDFFKKLKVKGAGPAVVAKIHQAGFMSVSEVATMSLNDYNTIFGNSSKTGKKLYEAVREALSEASLAEIINASNVLDKGFGLTRLEMIFEEYPRILSSSSVREKLMGLPGFSSKLADAFVSKIDEMNAFLMAIGRRGSSGQKVQRVQAVQRAQSVQRAQTAQTAQKAQFQELANKVQSMSIPKDLVGMNVLFTGIRNAEVEKMLKARGAKIATTFTNAVTHLVSKDVNADTGKAKKAREKGIPILSMEEIKNYT